MLIDDIFDNLKIRYPFVAKNVIASKLDGDMKLLVKLKTGESFCYDDHHGTIRQLPKDSNNLTEEEYRREFGIKLAEMIRSRGITQGALAEKLGIERHHISNYIHAKNMPSLYRLYEIARALNCSIDDFQYKGP